jgi:hypothetical protein
MYVIINLIYSRPECGFLMYNYYQESEDIWKYQGI